jgi:hypothetical protein
VILALVSLYSYRSRPTVRRIVLAARAILPPLWFWFDWAFIANYGNSWSEGQIEKFKISQELTARAWAALLTALAVIYVMEGSTEHTRHEGP